MITQKQLDLLRLIDSHMKDKGFTPSYEEMCEALELKSKSGIHRLVTALEERGFIRRIPNRARAIEVIRLPDGMASARSQSGSVARIGQAGKVSHLPKTVPVPLMGRIAAGTPLSAIQERGRSIDMPSDMLTAGEHYALEVRGDSMVEAGIHDGDLAIIRKQDSAESGEIVVALIDGEEATLKRFKRRGTSIALEPANAAYQTRILESGRVSIQGRLASIVRRY